MNRRTFLCGLTLGTLAAPLAAEAQQAERVYRIGWLGTYPPEEQANVRPGAVVNWEAFVQGLQEHDWIEKKNFVFERRYLLAAHPWSTAVGWRHLCWGKPDSATT